MTDEVSADASDLSATATSKLEGFMADVSWGKWAMAADSMQLDSAPSCSTTPLVGVASDHSWAQFQECYDAMTKATTTVKALVRGLKAAMIKNPELENAACRSLMESASAHVKSIA